MLTSTLSRSGGITRVSALPREERWRPGSGTVRIMSGPSSGVQGFMANLPPPSGVRPMHKAPSASAALTPERPAAPVALVARLEATCQDLLRLRRVRTLLRTAVALLLLAGLLACGDWVWVFGTNIRAAGLIALAVLAVAGTLRSLVA